MKIKKGCALACALLAVAASGASAQDVPPQQQQAQQLGGDDPRSITQVLAGDKATPGGARRRPTNPTRPPRPRPGPFPAPTPPEPPAPTPPAPTPPAPPGPRPVTGAACTNRPLGDTSGPDRSSWKPAILGEPTPEPLATLTTAYQRTRIEPALAALSPSEFAAFRTLVDSAASDDERAFLLKALISKNPKNNNICDLEGFAADIKGHDRAWLLDNCTITRGADVLEQQWENSCNATMLEGFLGDTDPIYALKLHQLDKQLHAADGLGRTGENPRVADEEKFLLESKTAADAAGKAVPRNASGGEGRYIEDWLNRMADRTGVSYTHKAYGVVAGDSVVSDLKASMTDGVMIPLLVGSGGSESHYVLCTNQIVQKDGTSSFRIFDPWTGTISVKSEAEIKRNADLNLGGWSNITGIDLPTRIPFGQTASTTARGLGGR